MTGKLSHEKIFKRPDGSRVKIHVVHETRYHAQVWVCAPNKRTFRHVSLSDDYRYRALPFGGEARDQMEMAHILEHCTREEIQETALELWEANKPDFIKS